MVVQWTSRHHSSMFGFKKVQVIKHSQHKTFIDHQWFDQISRLKFPFQASWSSIDEKGAHEQVSIISEMISLIIVATRRKKSPAFLGIPHHDADYNCYFHPLCGIPFLHPAVGSWLIGITSRESFRHFQREGVKKTENLRWKGWHHPHKAEWKRQNHFKYSILF